MNLLKGFSMVIDSEAVGAVLAVMLLSLAGYAWYRTVRHIISKFQPKKEKEPKAKLRPRANPLSDGNSIARAFNPELDVMDDNE